MHQNTMKNEYHDTEFIDETVKNLFTKNPNRSLSATFRKLRRFTKLSLIGDYPLLFRIIRVARSTGASVNRENIRYAFNQSEELKELRKKDKNTLVDQLYLSTQVNVNKEQIIK